MRLMLLVGCIEDWVLPCRVMRAIVQCGRYVVVICRAVLSELDDLKKGTGALNQRARDATRYVEERLAAKDRWIRVHDGDEFECCTALAQDTSQSAVVLLSNNPSSASWPGPVDTPAAFAHAVAIR